jgi:hypothetical protein
MCTPNNLSWNSIDFQARLFNSSTACEALVRKGVKRIFFHGDSYMRQIYAAMLITLNGNYRDGSIANATLAPDCKYHAQFFEKRCNTRQLNHHGVVCGGRITLDPIIAGFGDMGLCSKTEGSVVLWSFGNYKLSRYGRHGVNNATAYAEFFQKDICPALARKKASTMDALKATTPGTEQYSRLMRYGEVSESCSVWWVSTHYRMRAYFDDEQAPIVRNYNYGMRKYFDSGHCGHVNYIDVYNMTAGLGLHHSDVANRMTYDGVHWGFEVNLVKAQIIINALTLDP